MLLQAFDARKTYYDMILFAPSSDSSTPDQLVCYFFVQTKLYCGNFVDHKV